MGQARNWTVEELAYLEDHWGTVSIRGIATHLQRSVNAVKIKAQRRGLHDARFAADGITLNQLANALGIAYGIATAWVRDHGLPARRKVFAVERPVLLVRYEDFWRWAAQHPDRVNLARMEPNLLGPEPAWAKAKRDADVRNFQRLPKRPWSAADDQLLRAMVAAYRFTYPELAQALRRTESAIKRRLYDLGIKARPVRLDNHIPWTPDEVQTLCTLLQAGHGFNTIAQRLGRSELGMRQKLVQLTGHERAGAVRMREVTP